MKVYEGDNWDVDHKADDSPLTRADREANKIICDALMEWTPHIPIISEENKLVPYIIRKVRSTSSARFQLSLAGESVHWQCNRRPPLTDAESPSCKLGASLLF